MATRVTFICAGATASSRAGAFPSADEALDEGGRRKAAAVRWRGRRPDLVVASPARAAVETAGALGFVARVEPLLADRDVGEWAGRSLAAVHERTPDRLAAWFDDPISAPPGGESMAALAARVGAWLDRQPGSASAIAVVSHAAVMRAAIAHAVSAPLPAMMAIDVAPLTMLELSHHGRWRLRELRRYP